MQEVETQVEEAEALKEPAAKQIQTTESFANNERKPQTATRLRSRPKLVAPAASAAEVSYKRLPALDKFTTNQFTLDQFTADQFTDGFTYDGNKCGPPIKPGRGEGVGDVPNLTFVDEIDPSDMIQGYVGDCWLLSGISSLGRVQVPPNPLPARNHSYLEVRDAWLTPQAHLAR